MLENAITDFLGPGGRLSQRMADFEIRPPQIDMGQAVSRAFDAGRPLIVEAGTGTGKSLAYLIPAILWAVNNEKRVVISTYTKALQQQILHQDIPLLRQKLGLSFRYSVCMGHENYLSLRRMKRAGQAGLFTQSGEEDQFREIFHWAGETATGFRGDLPFEPMPSVWEEVGRQKDLCMGKNCESYDSCFYFKARKQWFGAQLLIVNHHMFFANVTGGWGLLPQFDAVVFDEAQNLEEAATSFLGLEVSNSNLFYFLDRLYHPRTGRGTLSRVGHDSVHTAQHQVTQVRQAVEVFFERLLEDFGRAGKTLRFYKPPVLNNSIYVPMQELHDSLKALEPRLGSDEDRLDIAAAATRCFEFNNTLTGLLNQHLEGYVYWLEIMERKRFPRVTLRGVPINVAEELNKQVFRKINRTILTSATLTTEQDFHFIKERIGFEPKEEQILKAPFDYQKQALIYAPKDIPLPGEDPDLFVNAVAQRSRELIQASRGRTFILFTSYAVLNRVYEQLETMRNDYPLLKQGELTPREMIRRFKETPSVIFGANSFWQGVDIPGDALKSVIITKLPFDVPNEPITEARLEDLRKNSIDPFTHYQIPRAILQLKQGFGRLIRRKTDTGVVSILDSRVVHKGYGRKFINSLPDSRLVHDLEDVKRFFNRGGED